jgi:hypothetical protein
MWPCHHCAVMYAALRVKTCTTIDFPFLFHRNRKLLGPKAAKSARPWCYVAHHMPRRRINDQEHSLVDTICDIFPCEMYVYISPHINCVEWVQTILRHDVSSSSLRFL